MIWATRKIGRPVKWTCERSECVQADEHGRDNVTEAEIALDENGIFLGLRVSTIANLGAYISSIRTCSPFSLTVTLVGVYKFPVAHSSVLGVMANCGNPPAPYRGAGRPEASYVMNGLLTKPPEK